MLSIRVSYLAALGIFNVLATAFNFPSGYAPVSASCPATPLVRAASGISSSEATYISARHAAASTSLAAWLKKTDSAFPTTNLPIVGLTTSGGGYRSLLTGAGVIQGFDSRDSNVGTSGLFQSLTYQAGLSGGAWLLSSFAGNNYPTITSLKTGLWETTLQSSLLDPDQLLAGLAYAEVVNDLNAKNAAGFSPTLTDPYGRLLSYQLLYGVDGGVTDRLSGIASLSSFTSHSVPYPIITSLGIQETQGQCKPSQNGTIYELHPYEFGSWDQGVAAFTQTSYLGTSLSNGTPTKAGVCTMNFDNLGFVLAASSNLFNEACIPGTLPSLNVGSFTGLATLLEEIHSVAFRDEYAVYPNPFYQRPASSLVATQQSLYLVDGGEALQNNPIWPFIQNNGRHADVLIVNDNSADTNDFPNGSEIFNTYVQAQTAGLSRMPFIPPVDTFVSDGLNKRPTFFGCNNPRALTIVYLPNDNYTFASNEPTAKLEYSKADMDAMIANGVQIAAKGGDPGWPTCLGCALTMKTGATLPAVCTACFSTYCFTQ